MMSSSPAEWGDDPDGTIEAAKSYMEFSEYMHSTVEMLSTVDSVRVYLESLDGARKEMIDSMGIPEGLMTGAFPDYHLIDYLPTIRPYRGKNAPSA